MSIKQQHDSFIRTLKANCDRIVDITEDGDAVSQVTISLGHGWAGKYAGGYWGDCAITDDELQITFSVGNVYEDDEFVIGEGIVSLNYTADNDGMAYTGELDEMVGSVLRRVTSGILHCSGSEQGMQDESYLSVDVEDMRELILEDRMQVA